MKGDIPRDWRTGPFRFPRPYDMDLAATGMSPTCGALCPWISGDTRLWRGLRWNVPQGSAEVRVDTGTPRRGGGR